MYTEQSAWREISKYLPEKNRINSDVFPKEYFIDWRGNKIHIDHYENKSASAKVLLIHGVGGNGRLLQFAGVPLFKKGYEIILWSFNW